MISTKGRYSIRILLDLAEHRNGSYIPMKDVAARQNISLKYIERLMPALKAAGLVDSVHGIGGGYRLTREPDQYTLWEILCLAQHPHHFGDRSFQSHVIGFQYGKFLLDHFSNLVDLHIAALMGYLSSHTYQFTGRDPV